MDASQPTLGDALRDRGMALATINTERETVHQVDLAIVRAIQRHPLITAETVRDELEDTYTLLGADVPTGVSKVIGARLNAAARRGLIRTTGMTTKAARPEAHSRRLLVWTRGGTA